MKKILLIVVTALLLGSCCSSCRWRYKNAKPLEGTVWHLVQIEGADKQLPVDTFNIILEEGSLGGRGACNSLLGQYVLEGKSGLRFSALGSTKMLCPQNEDLELALIGVLEATTHYDIDYDSLMLLHDGAIKAVFKALPSPKE